MFAVIEFFHNKDEKKIVPTNWILNFKKDINKNSSHSVYYCKDITVPPNFDIRIKKKVFDPKDQEGVYKAFIKKIFGEYYCIILFLYFIKLII